MPIQHLTVQINSTEYPYIDMLYYLLLVQIPDIKHLNSHE